MLDTHRLDRLGCYGYSRGTSPNIDAFAQEATLFERAISPAQWTIPSHASMFTGEPVSAHMTVHSSDVLDARYKTLAERLKAVGYRTVGFCNNPLVGVINNGVKRGFEAFYTYCGAVQNVPRSSERLPGALRRTWEALRRLTHKVTDPIQNAFATSSRVFQAALNPFWVPLWTRFARFKGDTPRSIRDATRFVREQMTEDKHPPHFLFLNLMEPHLPYSPPERFVRAFAPCIREERAAGDFVRAFNTQAMRWMIPLDKAFSPLEARAMSGMYDAAVAYQDHLLAELFSLLDRPANRQNTMVVLVADHGEMLGEHQLIGHAFGVYQELVQVPLIVRFPGQAAGRRVPDRVSATRLFHTALDVAGEEAYEAACGLTMDARGQSLIREAGGAGATQPTVFSEAYAPQFVLDIMEKHRPALIDKRSSRATNWAAYEGADKLIRVEGVRNELFSLDADPFEMDGIRSEAKGDRTSRLAVELDAFLEKARARRPASVRRRKASLDDEFLQQRLRGLGYIE